MSAVPTLNSVVLDCPDPRALSDFYAKLLEWSPDTSEDPDNEWSKIRGDGMAISFQRADDYEPPTWPDPERRQMLHLDLNVVDVESAHERALALGARHLDSQDTFRVYADPAGHPFCLCFD